MVARVTRLVAEKFVLSTFPRALTTLSSMCSRAVRALESSPGLIMMMDSSRRKGFRDGKRFPSPWFTENFAECEVQWIVGQPVADVVLWTFGNTDASLKLIE